MIAKLQPQTGHRGHLQIGAGHARHGHSETIVEIEFANGFAERIAIRYDHAARGNVALLQEKILIASPSHDPLELLQPRACADDRETIVHANNGRVGRGHCFIAAANARNGDARLDPARDRVDPHAVEIWIRYHERAALQWIDRRAVLLRESRGLAHGINAEDLFEQNQRSNDANDRHRVGNGVTESGEFQAVGRDVRQGAERLRTRAERGRVRDRAGVNSEHRRHVEPRQRADERCTDRAEEHDRRREQIQFYALIPQRGREPGAKLQADREDEEHQPELLHEMERVLIHRIAEMSDDNPGEKHAGGAQADAAEFQTAQRHSEHTDKGERADRVRDGLRLVKLEEPVHRLLETIIPILPAPVYRTLVFTLLCSELRAHFSSVLVRIQAGQKMANIVWEFHYSGDAFGFERGFADLLFVAQNNAESRLRTGIHPHDIPLAAKRGDIGGGFARGVRIPEPGFEPERWCRRLDRRFRLNFVCLGTGSL